MGTAPGVGTSTQFGSNAAKLSDYLSANKEQTSEFAGEVAGNLGEGYNKAKGSIDQGVNQFNQQVQGGYAQANDDLVNQAASDPTRFAQDPNSVSQFQSLYNNQYQGPQNFESSDSYAGINSDVNKAVENSSLVNSYSGLNSYLNNSMGSKNLTPGMQTLNTSLLMRDPNAYSTIKQAATPYTGLNDYLGTKKTEANAGVQGAISNADQIRQAVQNKFTGDQGVIPTFQADINQRIQDTRGKATANTQRERDALLNLQNQTGISLDDLNLLETRAGNFADVPGEYESLYGLINAIEASPDEKIRNTPYSLADFLSPTGTPDSITAGNTATADDYAREASLGQLTGGGFNPMLNQDDIGNAGTAPTDLQTFNVGDAIQQLMAIYGGGAAPMTPPISYPPESTPAEPQPLTPPSDVQRGGLGYTNPSRETIPTHLNPGVAKPDPAPTPQINPGVAPDTESVILDNPEESQGPSPVLDNPSPTGSYNPSDHTTWTLEQHPQGMQWDPRMGWVRGFYSSKSNGGK